MPDIRDVPSVTDDDRDLLGNENSRIAISYDQRNRRGKVIASGPAAHEIGKGCKYGLTALGVGGGLALLFMACKKK